MCAKPGYQRKLSHAPPYVQALILKTKHKKLSVLKSVYKSVSQSASYLNIDVILLTELHITPGFYLVRCYWKGDNY